MLASLSYRVRYIPDDIRRLTRRTLPASLANMLAPRTVSIQDAIAYVMTKEAQWYDAPCEIVGACYCSDGSDAVDVYTSNNFWTVWRDGGVTLYGEF